MPRACILDLHWSAFLNDFRRNGPTYFDLEAVNPDAKPHARRATGFDRGQGARSREGPRDLAGGAQQSREVKSTHFALESRIGIPGLGVDSLHWGTFRATIVA
jgi:hypothetical protein